MQSDDEIKKWRRPRKSIKGLGDVVELIAQPIAQTIDKILKTEVASCNTCKQRKEYLNKLLPFDKND